MTTTSSSRSLPRFLLAFVIAAAIMGVRAVPARAFDPCSLPVISTVCSAVSGIVDGVKFTVDEAGVVRDAITGKIIAFASKFGCKAATEGDRLGAGVLSQICQKATTWLGKKLLNTGPSSPPGPSGGGGYHGTGGTYGGAGPPTPPAQPPEGTPADALSTASMAALAGAATIFIADHVSKDTQANLTGGWFSSIYSAIENYAWVLATIAIAFMGLWVMAAGAVGAPTGLLALFFGIPKAAAMMVVTPVLAMAGIAIVDAMSSDLMHQFPDGLHVLHVMAGVLGVLAGTSLIAGHFGHAAVAHALGHGAWWVSAFGLITSGAVALELIAREIATYMTVLIIPLAAVGEIFSPFAGWATSLATALFVIIVTKLLLAIGLVLAGAMIATGLSLTSFSPITVIVGIITIGLMTLFPVVVYGALLRVESAWHTTVSTGVHAGPQHSFARRVRQANVRVRERVDRRRRPQYQSQPATP